MARRKDCTSCGCDRITTLVATISEPGCSVGFKRLCIVCFLGLLKVPREQIKKLDPYKDWMECVSDGKK